MEGQEFGVVFVHLGTEHPPTLQAFSSYLQETSYYPHRFLITDKKNSDLRFEGEVITTSEISQAGKSLLRSKPYYRKVASGYWLNAFERLFALRAIAENPHLPSGPIIHLESDVMPLFDATDIEFLRTNFSRTAVPRFSETLGIGSIVFFPNVQELISTLDALEKLAIDNRNQIRNDMELLGMALNRGLLMELPSHPSDYDKVLYRSNGEHKVLFDGAALGQFLFGQDPFHQSGLRVSGFINPSYALRTKIESIRWGIQFNKGQSELIACFNEDKFKVANIHVHSKEVLPPLSSNSKRWKRAIDEANGKVERLHELSNITSPHSKKLNLWLRIQIARSNGLNQALHRCLLRFFNRMR